ncbi:ComEA family DNA-binding protein [Candidatus Omnitrophota bacterium]
MLEISRSERSLILILLLAGLLCAGLSYYLKVTNSSCQSEIINIEEPLFLININTASALELERLPGIGPILAGDIVAYRQNTGGFKKITELKNIKGIGDKKLEKIKDHVTITK